MKRVDASELKAISVVGKLSTLLVAAVAAIHFAPGCSSDETEPRRCGPGTVKSGGQCIVEDASVGGAGGGSGGGVAGGGVGGTAGSGGSGGGVAGSGGSGGGVMDGGSDADASADADAGCGELSQAWLYFDAGAGPALPSCAGGGLGAAKNCGLAADEDCCESRSIPCGKYNRSNDTLYPAFVSPFRLDKFEVTVGRFRAFVQTQGATKLNPPSPGAGAHPIAGGTGWQAAWNASLADNPNDLKQKLLCHADATWTDAVGVKEKHPINCVGWYEAFAFCIWDGGRLPTESEWNFVAASGPGQFKYPTGLNLSTGEAVWKASYPESVGSRPPGYKQVWGHADLAGNVWEWAFDFWFPFYPLPCSDCANITPHISGVRVMRGGSFAESNPDYLTTLFRMSRAPTDRVRDVGFRCARAL